jgi:hypothetical protein
VAAATKAASRCRPSAPASNSFFSIVNNLNDKTLKNCFLSPYMLVMSGSLWLIKRRRRRRFFTYFLYLSLILPGGNYKVSE